jgi:diguanylate cyclase (GGDEF)-like protein
MKPALQPVSPADTLIASYAQLAADLLENVVGIGLLDGQLRLLGRSGSLDGKALTTQVRRSMRSGELQHGPAYLSQGPARCVTAIPLEQTDGTLLGVFCVQQAEPGVARTPTRTAAALARRLKPVLDCLHRELAAARREPAKVQVLTERTAELEWLFGITGKLKGAADEKRVIEELLHAAAERLNSAFAVLCVPEKRICVEHGFDPAQLTALRGVWERTRKHLTTWAQRQQRPLVVNGKPPAAHTEGRHAGRRCKILSVPIVRDTGRVIGVLAFLNPPEAADFAPREVFLARHLGRQAAALVEAQFDLMTGLYTRDGLEQMHGRMLEGTESIARSVIYLDIDHMDVVNELHGFELGNELIVRSAELLAPPLLPAEALVARLSGDRFAIVLPDTDVHAAAQMAAKVQAAANQLIIGPPGGAVDVSVSCGVAALIDMPQGLARALAAAEIACKKAKTRGRNRVELYACEDSSMMRRQDDIAAVGQLRAAFKADRLLLYAQRIVPLQRLDLPGGYEILMRLRAPDGTILAPGALIVAAQRYQLLPSIDRWVMQRTLQMLAPYRTTLTHCGMAFSLNVSGQSICDEAFVSQFAEQLQNAHLPRGCVTIEITEQAAVTNLVQADAMIRRLGALGCRLALDDFGTGANSLTNLKSLQIARVKIDGSFVRDIVTEKRSQATVRAIVELAKGYAIDTVAEFVENQAIADAVRKLGVDYAQGYAFGKPEPLDEVLTHLSQDESRRLQRLFLEL